MGFLSGLGRALGRIGQNVPMAQAALAGDYGSMASMRAQQERQRLAQLEAERELQARASQMEAAGQLGFGKPQIAAMSANDLSQVVRERISPYSLAPGTRRYEPGIGPNTPERMVEAPNPTEFRRALIEAGIDPDSERGRALAGQRAQNMANPMQAIDIQQPDGSVVRQYIRPPMGGAGPQPAQAAPQPGAIEDGYRFRGGDPANPESWERVQGGAAPSNGPRRFR